MASFADLALLLGPEKAREFVKRERATAARADDSLDVDQVASWLQVAESTVWEWRRRGLLPEPTGKRGRRVTWSRREIVAVLRAGLEEAP